MSLPGGKTLHLGPTARGQVHADALDRPQFKKLIEAGEIEVLDDGGHAAAGEASAGPLRESTRSRAAARVSKPKGDR